LDGTLKAEIIARFDSQKTIAFSDSYLDLPFLLRAHIAVAVNPKGKLKKIAKQQRWEIL